MKTVVCLFITLICYLRCKTIQFLFRGEKKKLASSGLNAPNHTLHASCFICLRVTDFHKWNKSARSISWFLTKEAVDDPKEAAHGADHRGNDFISPLNLLVTL